MAAIQNDTIVLAQCANLARVNEFEMFQDGYKDDRFALSYIDDRHIKIADFMTLPERFNVVHICMKGCVINEGWINSAHLRLLLVAEMPAVARTPARGVPTIDGCVVAATAQE